MKIFGWILRSMKTIIFFMQASKTVSLWKFENLQDLKKTDKKNYQLPFRL
jgi:hypothetical protein